MKFEEVNDDVEKTKPKKPIAKLDDNESLTFCTIDSLPSRNKFYPLGTEIKGRPLKLIELKKISTMTEENSDSVILDILRKSIRGVPVENIMSGDKLYLIFWLRANTYREPGYSVDFECDLCKQESSYDFNLNNLQVKYLDFEFSEDKLNFALSNEDVIEFHVPTIMDEKTINKFKITYASVLKDINSEFVDFSVMIDKINGESLEILEKYDYITNLSAKLYSQLKSKIKKWEFGIKPIMNVTCNKCGGSAQIGITFHEDFFIPNYKDELSPKDDS
jgi:hypothetical protein